MPDVGHASLRQEQEGPRWAQLGGGRRVPYAEPTSPAATKMGKSNTRTDTKAEIRLRSELHRRGLRFRKDFPVRVSSGRPVRPDVVFTKARVMVFLDGCFWHSCPEHGHVPKSNRDYWVPKLEGNVERDRRVDHMCADAGWEVIRIWEHEPLDSAASRVEAAVRVPDAAPPPRGDRSHPPRQALEVQR